MTIIMTIMVSNREMESREDRGLDDTLTGFNALSLSLDAPGLGKVGGMNGHDGMDAHAAMTNEEDTPNGVDSLRSHDFQSPMNGSGGASTDTTIHGTMDDDVLYIGSSITVKTEGMVNSSDVKEPAKSAHPPENDHSMDTHSSGETDKSASGWILSCVKSPKASLKHLVPGRKIVGLDSVNFGQDGMLTHVSGLCTRGSTSSTIVSNRSGKLSRHGTRKNAHYGHHYDDPSDHYGEKMDHYGDHSWSLRNAQNDAQDAPYGRHYDHHSGHIVRRPTNHHGISPESLNKWLMALLKAFVIISVIYVIAITALAIKRDIDNEIQKKRRMIKDEVLECQELYKKNQCSTLQIPALEEQCKKWESCMYKNELLYEETTSLSAEFLGGVINKFVSQLEIRTVIIVLLMFIAGLIGYNVVHSLRCKIFKRKNEHEQLYHQMLHYPPMIQNPYIVPNYFNMGGYPFIHDRCPQLDCYRRDSRHARKPTSAWKRRWTTE